MADWDTAFLASIKARTGPADANGCIIWTGVIDNKGQCRMSATVDKVHRIVLVQRYLWDYHHPTEQIGGLHVCQRNCGNKQCVNIDHLQRVPRKKHFDADAAWERLRGHGVRQDNGCLLANAPYKIMKLGENNMGLHKAAYMLHHKLAVPPPERVRETLGWSFGIFATTHVALSPPIWRMARSSQMTMRTRSPMGRCKGVSSIITFQSQRNLLDKSRRQGPLTAY